MSFFNNFIQNVSNTVSNLNLSPKRFPFSRPEGGPLQRTESAGGATAGRGRASPLHGGGAAGPSVGAVGRTASLPAPSGACPTRSPRSSQKKKRAKLLLATSAQKRDILYETSNSGVQETDGSFFEAFASLPWRQENRRMQSLKDEEEQRDKPPPSETSAGLEPRRLVISQQERESLYVEVLYTVKHKVGATTSQHSALVDELNGYAQEAFRFSRDQHQRMMTIASEEKPPIVILNLVVVEANGLEAKDADGLSDPFCMMGIVPGEHDFGSASEPHGCSDGGSVAPCRAEESSLTPYPGIAGFSDPYCMLGIVPGAVTGDRSTPPGSPRVSRPNVPPSEEDGEERQLNTHADKLRKHHSFRLSFKRKPESRPALVSSPSSCSTGSGGGREGHRDSVSLSHAVPAKFIRATTVKANTLDPHWEEKFRLDIDDVSSDVLHLDIWDHDDETSVLDAVSKLNEVKGVRGMARFFKQVAQSARSGSGGQDDFLGCVNISLQDIPSTGLDQWFTLEGRTAKSAVQGKIRLKMWLSTREDRGVSEEDVWSEVIQQQKLFELFVKHELSKYRGPSYKWSGELPTTATTILHQHAVQGDVTELQQAVCRWIAYSEQHQETSLDYRLLLKVLRQLNDKFTQDALTYEEQEALAESFKTTLSHCFAILRKLRKLFPAGNKEAHRKLDSLLKFLAAFSGMEIFRRVLPFQREIRSEISQTVKKGCVEWYTRLREQQQLDPSGDDAAVLQSLIRLVNEVCSHCFQAYNHQNQLFMQSVSVPYFATIYKQLEKLVSEELSKALVDLEVSADIQDTVGRLCSELQSSDIQLSTTPDAMSLTMGTATFELYMATKDLYKLGEHLPAIDRRSLAINFFQEWFSPAVARWLDVARFKILWRVSKAVELDKLSDREEYVRHSSAALDIASCFNQVREFWNQLEWPPHLDAHSLREKLLEDIITGAKYYAELCDQKSANQLALTPQGGTVSPELCAHINNMEHVRRPVQEMLDQFLQEEQPANGATMHQMSDGVSGGVSAMATSLSDELEGRVLEVCGELAEKMRPDLKRHIFHLAWSPDNLPTDEAICPLMAYLDHSLVGLHADLIKRNFDRALLQIWLVTISELKSQADSISDDKSPEFYGRLCEALEILRRFFHADGQGVPLNALKGELFDDTLRSLKLNSLSTEDLMAMFHTERLQEQETQEATEFGSLSVRVYFHHDSLSVEILSAKNVIPLDPNGLSDPFVIIELLPRHVFSNCVEQQTVVHKRTLNPVFDECFEYSVTLEQLQTEGAMILFTVMDHDVLTFNDFAGEAYLSLNQIPGVDRRTSNADNFHGLKEIELNLMHQHDREHPILKTLESRIADKAAQDFMKKCRERVTNF